VGDHYDRRSSPENRDTVADRFDLAYGSVGKSASQSSGMRRTASDMIWIA